jgi:hypothetical protein
MEEDFDLGLLEVLEEERKKLEEMKLELKSGRPRSEVATEKKDEGKGKEKENPITILNSPPVAAKTVSRASPSVRPRSLPSGLPLQLLTTRFFDAEMETDLPKYVMETSTLKSNAGSLIDNGMY